MTDQTEKTAETEEKPVEDAAPSLDDALSAAWEAHSDAETPEEKPVDAEPAPEAPEKVETEAAPVEAAPVDETPSPEMPTHWGEDGMAVWSALSAEQQQTVARHESERQNAINAEKLPDDVRNALGRVEAVATPWGLTPDKAIDNLVNAHMALTQNPSAAIRQLATQYGVDLASLGDQTPGTQQTDDPENRLLSAVDQRLNQFAQQMQATQAEAQIKQQEAEIIEWSKATDANGNRLRPHYDAVQHLLPNEVARVRTENPSIGPWKALETAYENVSKVAAPQQDIDAIVEQKVQERLQASAAEAKKAQQAAISPAAGASGQDGGPVSTGNIDDDLRNSYNKLMQEASGRIQ